MNSSRLAKLSWYCVLVALCSLILLLLVISFINQAFNPLFVIVLLIPLLLTVPGLIRGESRAFQWLCFVDLFFLVHGILLLFTPGWFYPGMTETLICLVMFISAIIFIRTSRITA
jgi:uncharacterized membrane protein